MNRSLGGGRQGLAPSVVWRLLALTVLFAVELTLLTVWFDFEDIGEPESRLSRWLVRVPMLMRLGSVAAAAMIGFSLTRIWPELRHNSERLCRVDAWPAFLLGHLAAMGAFAYGTQWILGGGLTGADHALLRIGAWLGAGGLGLLLWCLAALPWRLWQRLMFLGWPMLVVGGGVAVAVWRSKVYLKEFWRPLADGTFWLSRQFLSLGYSNIVSDPERFTLGTSAFAVNIARACSGYEGVGLVSAFLVAYLWLFRNRLRFPQALLLLPVGAAAIWISNSARIAVLIAIGSSWSREIARGGFHSQAGWIAFNAVALGLVALTGRSAFFTRREAARGTAYVRTSSPTLAYLAPFLAIVGLTMVTGAVTADFDWFYPLRVLVAGGLLWYFRKSYFDLRRTFSFEAFLVGVVTSGLWLWLTPAGEEGPRGMPEQLSTVAPALSGLWLAFRVLGYVVVAPLAEELAFRSYLTRRLIAADFSRLPAGKFTWLSFAVSSLAFGALHGRMWLPGILAGMLFAIILYRRRETADAVVAHATTNALLATYAFVTGDWTAWS